MHEDDLSIADMGSAGLAHLIGLELLFISLFCRMGITERDRRSSLKCTTLTTASAINHGNAVRIHGSGDGTCSITQLVYGTVLVRSGTVRYFTVSYRLPASRLPGRPLIGPSRRFPDME